MSSGLPRITGYGVGAPKITLNPPPIISTRNPTTTDNRFPLGQNWVNKSTDSVFELTSVSAGVASWITLGGGSGAVATLTGNTGGAISPTAGNINILGGSGVTVSGAGSTLTISLTGGGTAIDSFVPDAGTDPVVPTALGAVTMAGTTDQIITTGGLNTLTWSLSTTLIAPGSISSTTTITAGTGLTVTTGNATVTAGNIIATLGDIEAVEGTLRATNTGASSALICDTSGGTGETAQLTSSDPTINALTCIGGSIQVPATTNTPGASPQAVDARTGQVAFTDVISDGAYGTLTLTNSLITASSVILYCVSCTTANSALQIVDCVPGAGSAAFRIFNAGSAATDQNILVNFWILN